MQYEDQGAVCSWQHPGAGPEPAPTWGAPPAAQAADPGTHSFQRLFADSMAALAGSPPTAK